MVQQRVLQDPVEVLPRLCSSVLEEIEQSCDTKGSGDFFPVCDRGCPSGACREVEMRKSRFCLALENYS